LRSKLSVCDSPPLKNTRMTDFARADDFLPSARSGSSARRSCGRLRPRAVSPPTRRKSRREAPSQRACRGPREMSNMAVTSVHRFVVGRFFDVDLFGRDPLHAAVFHGVYRIAKLFVLPNGALDRATHTVIDSVPVQYGQINRFTFDHYPPRE